MAQTKSKWRNNNLVFHNGPVRLEGGYGMEVARTTADGDIHSHGIQILGADAASKYILDPPTSGVGVTLIAETTLAHTVAASSVENSVVIGLPSETYNSIVITPTSQGVHRGVAVQLIAVTSTRWAILPANSTNYAQVAMSTAI